MVVDVCLMERIICFRPLKAGLVLNTINNTNEGDVTMKSFRPLKAGLVLNPVPWNPRRYWAENALCG